MYGYIGSMRTKPGKRDEVIAHLLRSIGGLPAAGCLSYVVAECPDDPDRIWVTEVWESAQHHRASLRLPEVEAAIAEAMPLLTGEFTRQESRVVGGLGLPVGNAAGN
ncbi:MAG TPA: putative quinol monooxygenase [Pseudonocardia sp.]|uniref:putative quinol monooxygenase n=1 Tax=Pseudonocardia sp. TaxID=60912 RepID=UPI002B4B7FAF|nr:putative quinol monooxygenase [Pseudonocardia sp.]HLU57666.1 putative quinol monooxygenase [Pseudonocardia sp.]